MIEWIKGRVDPVAVLVLVAASCGAAGCGNVDPDAGGVTTYDPTTDNPTSGEPPQGDDGDCENGPLFWGPTMLPDAVVGEPYRVDVTEYAEPGWWGVGYSYDELGSPAWISFDPDTHEIYGEPPTVGIFNFTIEATFDIDENGCSTIPDPHEFVVRVGPMTGSTGEGSDSGSESEGESSGDSTTEGEATSGSGEAGTGTGPGGVG